MTYKWVCICRTTLDGAEYNIGDIWPGAGKSPVGNPAWTPVAVGEQPTPDVVVEVEGPKEAPPVPDWSSDESAERARAEYASWRKRGNR
jgi:hypothetical protein